MGSQHLINFLSVKRRYSRSVNLERDFDIPEAIDGYVLTDRAVDVLRRILASMVGRKRTTAWTLTGVYGTGKSAFAHFLISLLGPMKNAARQRALEIARHSLQNQGLGQSPEYEGLAQKFPPQGFFRAVATAQREPLSHTLVRALDRGGDQFWARGQEPPVMKRVSDWATEIEFGQASFSDRDLFTLIQQISEVVNTDMVLVIDELGKSLEYATQHQGIADLYLLQQLAELSQKKGSRLYLIGLLHQSFADYGQRLAVVEKNEWAKIQGRFEDIPFTESSQQMLRLMGQALDRSQATTLTAPVETFTQNWCAVLQEKTQLREFSAPLLAAVYPLHPLTALVLPALFIRYAQNDRSLFTFLTSAEPHGFQHFLESTPIVFPAPRAKAIVAEDQGLYLSTNLPTLKLHHLYDYFVESLGAGLRPGLARWLEIQTLVADAQHRGPDTLALLKTIGLLNLLTSTGALRATRPLVKLALVDQPDPEALAHWEAQIHQVTHDQGIVTYRRAVDELRLWEGSDFDVEGTIAQYLARESLPLGALLTETYPLKPLVAQRHSYRTGTLRYFERYYLDRDQDLASLDCTQADGDGAVVYWLGEAAPLEVPASTVDGKPLVVVAAANLSLLAIRAQEYHALCQLQNRESALQSDKVALKEVRHRRLQLKQLLDDTLTQAFNFALHHNLCWVEGKIQPIANVQEFNALLSQVCDRVYSQTPILWNELINRRTLTSQGAKARRLLLEAMLERSEVARLGLEGYGPEVAMYASVLQHSGIHRQERGVWGIYPPPETPSQAARVVLGVDGHGRSDLGGIWRVMAEFCLGATAAPRSLGDLYGVLQRPPYGMKAGAIPVVLAAVLLHYRDEVSIYKEGTFIPVLGPEHFELLVKDATRFSVKQIAVTGVRSQVFRELEAVLRGAIGKPQGPVQARNLTVLSVVKPLIQFVRKLPNYTLKTHRISERSRAVLQTLRTTQEPDELLFRALPQACGLEPIRVGVGEDDGTLARTYRERLVVALREIHGAYEALLTECQGLLYSAFGVHGNGPGPEGEALTPLRQGLQWRAGRIRRDCVEAGLRRFVGAVLEHGEDDRQWLAAVVMTIADKPAESWQDEDIIQFELTLSDLARRFRNLEAVQGAMGAVNPGGVKARRLTVTQENGEEINKLVWVSAEQQARVDPSIDELLRQLPDPQLREVFLARLAERLFQSSPAEDSETGSAADPAQWQQVPPHLTPTISSESSGVGRDGRRRRTRSRGGWKS